MADPAAHYKPLILILLRGSQPYCFNANGKEYDYARRPPTYELHITLPKYKRLPVLVVVFQQPLLLLHYIRCFLLQFSSLPFYKRGRQVLQTSSSPGTLIEIKARTNRNSWQTYCVPTFHQCQNVRNLATFSQ